MSYCFSRRDIQEFLSFQDGSTIHILPDKKAFFRGVKKVISEDIMLTRHHNTVNDDISIDFNSYKTNMISISYMLDGYMNYKNKNKKFCFDKSKMGIYYTQNIGGVEQLKKGAHIQSMSIFINKDSLMQPLSSLLDANSDFQMLKYAKIKPKTISLLKEVYSFEAKDALDNIYLQSKVLELIHTEFNSLKEEKKRHCIQFSNYDKQALENAYYILETSYKNPPSITQLSKMVRLNEFKLKYGFKHFFGNSIYQTLLSHRMEKAKTLLSSKELNVSEASKEVGYKYVQSFSVAFNKYYGINPKSFLKNY